MSVLQRKKCNPTFRSCSSSSLLYKALLQYTKKKPTYIKPQCKAILESCGQFCHHMTLSHTHASMIQVVIFNPFPTLPLPHTFFFKSEMIWVAIFFIQICHQTSRYSILMYRPCRLPRHCHTYMDSSSDPLHIYSDLGQIGMCEIPKIIHNEKIEVVWLCVCRDVHNNKV